MKIKIGIKLQSAQTVPDEYMLLIILWDGKNRRFVVF